MLRDIDIEFTKAVLIVPSSALIFIAFEALNIYNGVYLPSILLLSFFVCTMPVAFYINYRMKSSEDSDAKIEAKVKKLSRIEVFFTITSAIYFSAYAIYAYYVSIYGLFVDFRWVDLAFIFFATDGIRETGMSVYELKEFNWEDYEEHLLYELAAREEQATELK